MKTLFIVQPEEAQLARKMEKKLLSLPEASGILFVGIDVVQALTPDRLPVYRVFIGCNRERDPDLMDAIVKRYLRDEGIHESQLEITASRGFAKI